jgi:hypothetical protein
VALQWAMCAVFSPTVHVDVWKLPLLLSSSRLLLVVSL